jgi:hypothetical protein
MVEIQIMTDAFEMFRGRPLTNLNFRIPQLALLVNSPAEMRQIAEVFEIQIPKGKAAARASKTASVNDYRQPPTLSGAAHSH